VGFGEPGKRDEVGARAGRDREGVEIAREDVAEAGGHGAGELVVTVGRGRPVIRGDDRFEQLRGDAAHVVAAEIVNFSAHWHA